MSNPVNPMEAFGGSIYIDANGSYIYECECCRFRSGLAVCFELHVKQHEEELRRSINIPKYQPPAGATSTSTTMPSTPSSSRTQRGFDSGFRQRERDSFRPTSHHHRHEHRAEPYMKREPTKTYATFECQTCKMKLNSAYQLKSHHEHCHSLMCMYCRTDQVQPKPFKTEQGFWGHQRKQHADIFQFKCTICIRAFKYRHELNHHRLNGHKSRMKSVNCDHCSRIFRSIFEKDEHVKDEHGHHTAKTNMN